MGTLSYKIMEDIPHINIDELYETKQKTDILRVSLYNKLLSKIHFKIKVASKQRTQNQFCYYIMPEVLIGYPNYDFNECLIYIVSCLEQDGFLVKYIHPNLILISWNHWVPEYVRNEIKRKTGRIINKFGVDVTTENLDKNNGILKKSKSVSFNNNDQSKPSKQVTNETYVPSGKFIYSNDLLDTIRDKI